jgi:hypothetical protein
MRWHFVGTTGAGVVCLLMWAGLGCSPQGHPRSEHRDQSASSGIHAVTPTELSNNDTATQGPAMTASAFGQWESELLGQSFDAFKSSVVETCDRYQNHEFRQYEMFGVIRNLIDQIDEEEMQAFFIERGVRLVPEEVLTSANVIACLQHKNLGTPAAYAWLDLTKGNPDFARAVQDWQTLRQERGLEFAPTFVLLVNAKLMTKEEAEVWADIFKTAFATLSEQDGDKKMVMLSCLLYRLPRDLKAIDPPAAERIAFLAEELKTQGAPQPYRQMVLLALYEARFFADQFTEAATWAGGLEPPATGRSLAFIAQVLAKDLNGAAATFSKIQKVAPDDRKTLDRCRQTLSQMKEMKQKQEAIKPAGTKP